MFAPLSVLVQNESKLYTPEDLVLALDRWVLPKYTEQMTQNPAITKLECMGVLKSFHDAGKFDISLKPGEVCRAVDAFLEDRLWVNTELLSTLELLPNQRPEMWMMRPNLTRVVFNAIPNLVFDAVFTFFSIMKLGILGTYYGFRTEREIKLPKSPTPRKAASISLIKKDS